MDKLLRAAEIAEDELSDEGSLGSVPSETSTAIEMRQESRAPPEHPRTLCFHSGKNWG